MTREELEKEEYDMMKEKEKKSEYQLAKDGE